MLTSPRAVLALFLLLLLVPACSSDADSSPGATGASGAAGAAGGAGAGGAGASGASGAAGKAGTAGAGPTSCPVAPEPTDLPKVSSVFLFEDPAKGVTIPVPTGGDPTGTWRITKSTVFLPEIGKGIVDTTKSTSTTTGFFAFEAGGTYRSKFHTDTLLVTSLLGDIDSTTDTESSGGYTTKNNVLTVAPKCLVVTGDATTDPNIGYSVTGDTLVTITVLMTGQGNSTLVTESTRVKLAGGGTAGRRDGGTAGRRDGGTAGRRSLTPGPRSPGGRGETWRLGTAGGRERRRRIIMTARRAMVAVRAWPGRGDSPGDRSRRVEWSE